MNALEENLEFKRQVARSTISSRAFYYLVSHALIQDEPLSVVRMGDGEARLYRECRELGSTSLRRKLPVETFHKELREQLGIEGIPYELLERRIEEAADRCTYFAPSITGLTNPQFDLYSLFPSRTRYVDNFWVNDWTYEQKAELFKLADKILLIHHKTEVADAMQNNTWRLLGKQGMVQYVKMSSWRETTQVLSAAVCSDARLILLCAGPAGKYLAPAIASKRTFGGQARVVLDIGNSIDQWTFGLCKELKL